MAGALAAVDRVHALFLRVAAVPGLTSGVRIVGCAFLLSRAAASFSADRHTCVIFTAAASAAAAAASHTAVAAANTAGDTAVVFSGVTVASRAETSHGRDSSTAATALAALHLHQRAAAAAAACDACAAGPAVTFAAAAAARLRLLPAQWTALSLRLQCL